MRGSLGFEAEGVDQMPPKGSRRRHLDRFEDFLADLEVAAIPLDYGLLQQR